MRIARNGTRRRRRRQQFMHFFRGAYFRRSGIDGEDERENDRKQDRSVGAVERVH